jgi:hypothetical protein
MAKRSNFFLPLPLWERSIGSGMPPACPEQRGALFTQSWARAEGVGRVRVTGASVMSFTRPHSVLRATFSRWEKGLQRACPC